MQSQSAPIAAAASTVVADVLLAVEALVCSLQPLLLLTIVAITFYVSIKLTVAVYE